MVPRPEELGKDLASHAAEHFRVAIQMDGTSEPDLAVQSAQVVPKHGFHRRRAEPAVLAKDGVTFGRVRMHRYLQMPSGVMKGIESKSRPKSEE